MAGTPADLAFSFMAFMTTHISSADPAWIAAGGRLAVCRAKGLPGPPRLPLPKRPFASRCVVAWFVPVFAALLLKLLMFVPSKKWSIEALSAGEGRQAYRSRFLVM